LKKLGGAARGKAKSSCHPRNKQERIMASIAAQADAGQKALDASNDRLAALLNRTDLSAGDLMEEMNKENGVAAFAQGFLSKNKDDNKFVSRLA